MANGEFCLYPDKWKSCPFYHSELGKKKFKKKKKKNYPESVLLRNMVNTSENISVNNMKDEILSAVLKVVKSDIKVNNEVKDEVKRTFENSNGEFEHLDQIFNNKIEAAEKR